MTACRKPFLRGHLRDFSPTSPPQATAEGTRPESPIYDALRHVTTPSCVSFVYPNRLHGKRTARLAESSQSGTALLSAPVM